MRQCTLILVTILHILMQYLTILMQESIPTLLDLMDTPIQFQKASLSHVLTRKVGNVLKIGFLKLRQKQPYVIIVNMLMI